MFVCNLARQVLLEVVVTNLALQIYATISQLIVRANIRVSHI